MHENRLDDMHIWQDSNPTTIPTKLKNSDQQKLNYQQGMKTNTNTKKHSQNSVNT